jgi:hypothetical protein
MSDTLMHDERRSVCALGARCRARCTLQVAKKIISQVFVSDQNLSQNRKYCRAQMLGSKL